MDNEMGNIKYVQLESGDFLADPDFQLMTSTERGIYCSVIFYMYLNDGRILNDSERIEKLCNADINFESSWKTVQKKFVEKNGYLTHKRVRKELAKAKRFLQRQRNAGLASAAARQPRFNHGSTTDATTAQPYKVKEKKVKESKIKEKKDYPIPPSISEIENYCKEKKIYVNAQDFIEFYGSKGWKIGKNKMVDWRLAVCRAAKWERNAAKQPSVNQSLTLAKQAACLVCHSAARHYKLNRQGQPLFLCNDCIDCLKAINSKMTSWGFMAKAMIERKVGEGKAKLAAR